MSEERGAAAFRLGGSSQEEINHVVVLCLAGVGLSAALGLTIDALLRYLLPPAAPEPKVTKPTKGAWFLGVSPFGASIVEPRSAAPERPQALSLLCINPFGASGAATPMTLAAEGAAAEGGDAASSAEAISISSPPAWSVILLLVSYALLMPGLFSELFSFNIMVDFGLIKLGVGPGGGLDKVPPVTESMLGLVHLLQTTDCPLGAAAVILYAIVIPGLKLVLLLLAPILARRHPASASTCVLVVQSISKWACPDMFAYILLMYLVRGLNHPTMLQARFQLDVGFAYFSVFCVVSTIASLGIQVKGATGRSGCWRHLAESFGVPRALRLAGFAAVGCMVLFAAGLSMPVMSLRISLDDMYEPQGPIPRSVWMIPLKPVIDGLEIPRKANSDVSLCEAISKLLVWTLDGEATSALAFVMLVVFVIGATILDLLLLAEAARRISARRRVGRRLLKAAAVLRKVSMLDVLIAGVAVVTFCMSMYEKDGIFVSMRLGQLALLAAELLHHLIFYLVTTAAQLHDQTLQTEQRKAEVARWAQEEESLIARFTNLWSSE